MPAGTYTFKGTADMKAHDRAIEQSTEKVKQFQEQTDKATNSSQNLNNVNYNKAFQSQATLQRNIKNTTTLLNGMQGNMLNAIGKFGVYAAAAAAAIGVASKGFNKVISQSDAWSDKFEGIMSGLNGVIDRFAYNIGSMDFSHFISGLAAAYRNAKDLRDALDDLGTFEILNEDIIDELTTRIEELKYELKLHPGDANLSSEYEKELGALASQTEKYLLRIKNARIKAIKNVLNWDDDISPLGPLPSNNGYYGNGDNAAEQMWKDVRRYKEEVTDLDGELDKVNEKLKNRKKELGGGFGSTVNLGNDATYKALSQQKAAIEVAIKLTDEDIKKVTDLNGKYRQAQKNLAQARRQSLRYLKDEENPKVTVPVEPTAPEGSLKKLQEDLAKAELAFNIAVNDEDRRKALDTINEIQEKIESIELLKDPIPEGSIKEIEKKLADKKIELRLAINQADRDRIKQEIKELTDELSEMNGDVKNDPLEGSIAYYRQKIAEAREIFENTDDAQLRLEAQIDMEGWNENIEKIQRDARTTTQVAKDTEEELNKSIDSIKRNAEELGGKLSSVVGSIGSAFSSLANVFKDDVARTWVSAAGTIISQIGEMIPHIFELIAAQQAEAKVASANALAEGVAGAAKVPFPGSIPAIAAIAAQIMAIIGTIGSLANSSKYATGGIVNSPYTHGDRNFIRVNGGEMILNSGQQTRLFQMLNGIATPNPAPAISGEVKFRITGSDLVGALDNYNKTHRRIQ